MATLRDVHSIGTLQKSYNFELSFPVIPSMLMGIPNLSSHMNARCLNSDIPTARFENVSVRPHGITVIDTGLVDISGEINITLVETEDMTIRRAIWEMRQIYMNDKTRIQQEMSLDKAGNQSLQVCLKRLSTGLKPVWIYNMFKVFISGYTDPAFDGQAGAVTPSLTLTYNWFEDRPASVLI